MDRSVWQDGSYDCLDRSDEVEDSAAVESESNSNLTETVDIRTLLPDCNDSNGEPGLYCGGYSSSDCLRLGFWCDGNNRNCLDTAGTERSSDEDTVCQSTVLWRDKECPSDYRPYRCRGSRPGECVSQSTVCNGKIGEEDGCEDKSDEICDTSRCNGGGLTLLLMLILLLCCYN